MCVVQSLLLVNLHLGCQTLCVPNFCNFFFHKFLQKQNYLDHLVFHRQHHFHLYYDQIRLHPSPALPLFSFSETLMRINSINNLFSFQVELVSRLQMCNNGYIPYLKLDVLRTCLSYQLRSVTILPRVISYVGPSTIHLPDGSAELNGKFPISWSGHDHL